ncbi:MAG: penicillin-binding protein 2, partial [Alphaproteobacteria bacterium]|nr:penicillin-binding protein 2 [Alphaproteobacteria bacterium]
NRINLRLLAPPRGRIVDRFGVPMAVNQQNYRVVLISEAAEDVEETLGRLGAIIPIGDGEKRRILRDIGRRRGFVPVTVRENLNWEEVARIEVNMPDLPGVMIDVGQSRHYPHGGDTAHVLGYVAAVSEAEIGRDPLLELPGFRIGKAGIEKVYDLALRGTGGSSQVEVNALGRVIRELRRREGQPGAEVTLTIDVELQKMVVRRLAGESASAVVMDVHTGDVLAMASTPSFDPNGFNKGLSAEAWRELVSNPMAPLTNKAIRGQYAPGSTFKIVVALAALEKGAITPANRFFCTGEFKLGDATFHCWKKGGHGWMDAFNGVMQSCDVFFYEVARRTGIERIAAMSRRLGFGSTLGLDLPGEQPGLVPSREWKRKTMNAPWHQGETVVTGIGQGYLLATPLQMAVMTARLANGGLKVTPRLTRPRFAAETGETDSSPQFESLNLVPQHLQLVRQAMEGVVNNPRGTAYRARIRKRGMAMGGKTGTVQVRRITKAEREQGVKKNKDLPWKERDHAMFVAFAPIDAPRYAVIVVVEHGGGGSKVAAPIARDILIKAQQRRSARPGILPKAPGGGQQVMRPGGNKPGAKPGTRSRDEG